MAVRYTYDSYGRLTGQTYEDGSTVTYAYDNTGALATVTDSASGIKTTYYYDLTDRLIQYTETGTGHSHAVGYVYDRENKLTSLTEKINGTAFTTSYTYDDDNRVSSITDRGITESYTYDAYGRVTQKVTKNGSTTVLTETYTYRTVSGKPTGQIATHRSVSAGRDVTYSYNYDANGNITSVSDGTHTTTYVYDSANQLTRENNQADGVTRTFTYDRAGNITAWTEYAYTTGTLGAATATHGYTYGNSNWGDQLTAWNGNTITGDAIGNMLSDGTRNYTWRNGRELATVTKGGVTWTNTYNADGIRTKRTNGTNTYSYIYNGGSLSQMTVDGTVMNFAYDASGTPMALTYGGATYYYATNIQGDVVAILNASGTAVVTYTYDAWGNILTTTGTMASTLGTHNPLRYRGYVYDHETGLYYLQSRYYNPELGRFLNADSFASTGQGVLGNNMFAYCLNNPVNGADPQGLWTIGFSIGGNITFLLGVSISIGIFFDGKGNIDVQWSYSATGVDNTNTVGGVDAGVGLVVQYTDRETVYDLYGAATSIGASVGPSWYVGADAISFSDASDLNGSMNGIQIAGGFGVGVDAHIVESNTKPLLPKIKSSSIGPENTHTFGPASR